MKKYIILLLVTAALNACGQSCQELPKSFSSYNEASSLIKKASHQYQDRMNTSKSSWIRSASFYSCDGQSGYMILGTDRKDYIFQNVPTNIWVNFKSASSFGSYYNRNIKGRYQLQLH